ncbi:MAG: protein kinase domain-containing protein [Acidobacteriota bacterium]
MRGVPDPDLSGTVLDDRYQVIEPIAEGAMGAVYRGERLKLGRAVAIKILHDALPDELASRERFEREAKLMARLEHPNCVSVIDFGLHEDRPFLVMELVRGTSLLDLIEREKRIEPARAVDILRQILAGLGHAHELGIVHRDIKPANIMVGERTGIGLQVRILDFGLARLTETSTKLTTGIVVGTPNYMSPEQCRGGAIDGRVDLYACGVILFEMLTGKKPFLADDPIQVVRMHMTKPPPRLADIAPGGDFGELEAVVARALAKDPADRYASAADMARALEAAIAARRSLPNPVPQIVASPPSAPQVATASGWSVPAGMAETASGEAVRRPASDLRPEPERVSAPVAAPPLPPLPPLPEPVSAPVPAPVAVSGPHSGPASAPDAGRRMPVAGPKLPFTRKQMMIGAGSLLGVIVLIAIVASGHSSSGSAPIVHDAGVKHDQPQPTQGDPVGAIVAEANDDLANGERERALAVVLRGQRDFPDSAQLDYIAGRIYFGKLYWTDGIKNFREAIRLDPSYRSDPELIKAALRGFITTPYVERDLEEFLHDDIGDAAIPYLEETAKDHPNPTIRARAEAELRRFR